MTDEGSVAGAVARTIRTSRAERGWSQDALAARAGVSKGVLVGLEQGNANPSLGTLLRVSEAIGVPLTRLVQVERRPVIRVLTADRHVTLWHGDVAGTGTLVAGTDPALGVSGPEAGGGTAGPTMELWRWELHPGEVRSAEAHRPGCREIVLVDEGCVSLEVAGHREVLGTGTAAVYPGDEPHRYDNPGNVPTRFTMAVLDG